MKKKKIHNEQLGFHVPEGYFEASKKEMLIQLKQSEKNSTLLAAGWQPLALAFCVFAALLTGIFTTSISSYSTESFEQLTIESLEVSDEDFDQWFDENFVLNEV